MKTSLTIVLLLFSCLSVAAQSHLKTGQYLLSETGTTIVSLHGTNETFKLNPNPTLTIRDFEEALVANHETMMGKMRMILIKLTPEGRRKFREFTEANVGNLSGTVLGGKLYTAIQITAPFDVHYLEIPVTGTRRSVKQLVKKLNLDINHPNVKTAQ